MFPRCSATNDVSGLAPNRKLINEGQLEYELENGAKNFEMLSSFAANPLLLFFDLSKALAVPLSGAIHSPWVQAGPAQSLQGSESDTIVGNWVLVMGCAVVVASKELIDVRDLCHEIRT